jgi:hypothetical protein
MPPATEPTTRIKSITKRGPLDAPRTTKISAQPIPQLRAQEKGHTRQARAARQVLANHHWSRIRQNRVARLTKVIHPSKTAA